MKMILFIDIFMDWISVDIVLNSVNSKNANKLLVLWGDDHFL